MKFCSIGLFAFLLCNVGFAQGRTYIGLESTLAADAVHEADFNLNAMSIYSRSRGYFGFLAARDLGPIMRFEPGFYARRYVPGFGFTMHERWRVARLHYKSFQTYQVPLRLLASVPTRSKNLRFVSAVGIVLWGYGGISDSRDTAVLSNLFDTLRYSYVTNAPAVYKMALIQSGIGAEYALGGSFLVEASVNMVLGFKDIGVIEVEYEYLGTHTQSKVYTKGNAIGLTLKVKYMVSNMWQKPRGINDNDL